jgi:REP element-mobilizing transposase RayT
MATGWTFRGYLPHYDAERVIQHVVFRLADSLPKSVLVDLESLPAWERADAADKDLDRGHGSRALAQPDIAAVVEETLLKFDGQRYLLHAWTIMPTHVHVLCAQRSEFDLSSVVHSWKSYTANFANRRLGRTGPFWGREYFDRYVRSEDHYGTVKRYIEHNPVAAGLCAQAGDWRFGSARRNAGS